jgi:hypothetical protein
MVWWNTTMFMAKRKTKPVSTQAPVSRKTPRRHVPIPVDLASRLEAVADANERPLGWEAARAIKAHVEAEEKRLGITPTSAAD